jgi:hypothetical protein
VDTSHSERNEERTEEKRRKWEKGRLEGKKRRERTEKYGSPQKKK